jgi:hypothetical protein
MARDSADNPDAVVPAARLHAAAHALAAAQDLPDDDLIVILYEANAGVRQIFMDGRPAPPKDAQPWWFGYSRGSWEGDTLVVGEHELPRRRGGSTSNGAPLTTEGKADRAVPRVNAGPASRST